jgi:tRNA G18 (ribose-2'-O)-methylase SpoU
VSIRIDITDVGDPRLGDFRDLKRADRRPDRPGGRGLVIAEGAVVVRRMIASAYPLRALLGVARRYDELRGDLADRPVPFYVADAETMAEVVGFHLNRGVLATADRVAFPDAAGLLGAARRVAVLEGVGDHENIGAIFRNAAALGIDAVLLAGGCADPLYRRSVRVSMGTVLAVPFAPMPPLADGGAELLRRHGFRVVALTPRPDAVPITEVADLVGSTTHGGGPGCAPGSGGPRVAVVLGAEGPGLSDASLAAADTLARIPMARGVDSLNVATAGAIAFAQIALGD